MIILKSYYMLCLKSQCSEAFKQDIFSSKGSLKLYIWKILAYQLEKLFYIGSILL